MRAAVYARVSTLDQNPENQLALSFYTDEDELFVLERPARARSLPIASVPS